MSVCQLERPVLMFLRKLLLLPLPLAGSLDEAGRRLFRGGGILVNGAPPDSLLIAIVRLLPLAHYWIVSKQSEQPLPA